MISGTAIVNNYDLHEGDGLSFSKESEIVITDPVESEIILFDLT